LLNVDVLLICDGKNLSLRPNAHHVSAISLLFQRSHSLQQGQHGTPLDVMARRVLKQLQKGVAVVIVQMLWS
jgi:hypothetical protein